MCPPHVWDEIRLCFKAGCLLPYLRGIPTYSCKHTNTSKSICLLRTQCCSYLDCIISCLNGPSLPSYSYIRTQTSKRCMHITPPVLLHVSIVTQWKHRYLSDAQCPLIEEPVVCAYACEASVSPPTLSLCWGCGCWVTTAGGKAEYIHQKGRVVDIFHCSPAGTKPRIHIKLETARIRKSLHNSDSIKML